MLPKRIKMSSSQLSLAKEQYKRVGTSIVVILVRLPETLTPLLTGNCIPGTLPLLLSNHLSTDRN